MPAIQLRPQSAQPLAELAIFSLGSEVRLARFGYTGLLYSHGFAGVIQVLLSAMPVITVPLAQEHAQISLRGRELIGAPGLSLQSLQTRLKLSHDVLHAFQVSLRILQAFERFLAPHAIESHTGRLLEADLRALEGVTVRSVSDRAFLMHLGGKIEVKGRVAVRTRDDLSLVYTPGVVQNRRSAPQKQPMPNSACCIPTGNGAFSGWPLTKWRSGAGICAARPGSVRSAGSSVFSFCIKENISNLRSRLPAAGLYCTVGRVSRIQSFS